MATIADRISEVKSKATSYKTAYLKAEDPRCGFTYFVLGYSKSQGICTVLVKSPFCGPCGEYGTAYYREIAHLRTDPTFKPCPSKDVAK